MDYNDYLKVPELLSLQQPLSKPPHHDELLFIVIHQAFELWFKLQIHELEAATRAMLAGDARRAAHTLARATEVQRLFIPQIHLLETMTPVEFLQFRGHLKPASGFQSLQFREIEFMAGLKDPAYLAFFRERPAVLERLRARMAEPDLTSAFFALVRGRGLTLPRDPTQDSEATARSLLPIYEEAETNRDLYGLAEAMLDFDEAFALWRDHHVRVVERIIGHKRGTGGSSGAAYLRGTTSKRFFPFLWDVRTLLGEPR